MTVRRSRAALNRLDMVFVRSCFSSRLPSRRKAEVSAAVSESSEARQKFANAKAISSDMFFGRESSAEVRNHAFRSRPRFCGHPAGVDCSSLLSQYDAKTRLENMSGSTSISSADLFGDGSDHKGKSGQSHLSSISVLLGGETWTNHRTLQGVGVKD